MCSWRFLTPLSNQLKRGCPDHASPRYPIEHLRTGPECRRPDPPFEPTHPWIRRAERSATRNRVMDRNGVQPNPLQQRAERLRRIQKEMKRLIVSRPDPPGRCPHREMKCPIGGSDHDETDGVQGPAAWPKRGGG